MNRKNNKTGFTLIELLAVIIILAVIALIATPIVLNVVDNAKKQANKNSVYGLLDGAKLYYTESLLDSNKSSNINGTTNLINEISISGQKPESGSIYINRSGETALAVVYDKVCYKKNFNENEITETNDIDNCKLNMDDIIMAYQVGDRVTLTDGNNSTSEWYVLEDSDSSNSTVKLLSAKSLDYIYYDGSEETCGSSNYETSMIKVYLDNYMNYLNLSSKINEIRLLNKSELESLGCDFSTGQCKNSPSWLHSPSYYWTMVITPSDGIWTVEDSYLSEETYCTESNVRPVIIVSKEVITKTN